MKTKEVVDGLTMKRAITRITYEIIERNKELDKIVLIGIKTRGVYIAQRIQERRLPATTSSDTHARRTFVYLSIFHLWSESWTDRPSSLRWPAWHT